MIVTVPICLFTFIRLSNTKKTIESLQQNPLAIKSNLCIFSDGPRSCEEAVKVEALREYLKTVNGFKSVTIIESETNKGLATSVIEGVTKILETSESVIVLEDDLVFSSNFLDFMNQALNYYKSIDKVFSVSGYSMNLKSLDNLQKDFYFNYRMSSWGWGIWRDRWMKINWDDAYYEDFKTDPKKQKQFKKGGSDMPRMLKSYLSRKINSWAIRACYYQFENDLLTIAPKRTKVNNIGFGKDATHTVGRNRYDAILDSTAQEKFDFTDDTSVDPIIVAEFKSRYSLFNRIKSRILDLI